jgi:predicted ATPase/DNA-binding SARP family transcriptional activator
MPLNSTGASPLEVRFFGACEILVDAKPLPPLRYRKDLWLFALLALRHDIESSRDWLAATLWPDADEAQGRYYLRRSLSNLRQALGTQAHRLLTPTSRTLCLDLTGASVDVAIFDSVLQKAPDEQALERAIALYRGPLLVDCTEEWVLPERNAREQAYLGALEQLAHRLLARGEPAAAVRPLRLLTAADPYRESAACALMQALADSGDRAAMEQVYRSLRQVLRFELNTDPAPETQALYKRLSTQLAQPVALPRAEPAGRAAGRHLPVPLTDLIGREREIDEITGWLRRCRLVTLLGPGGVGKTRLSIAAAEVELPEFAGGVWFVDLAPVSNAGNVTDVVARTLGVPEQAGRTREEQLADALADRSLLLLLDNCEHLLEAVAALAQSLLAACAGLRILATSRQSLGLTGEQTYQVPSLSLPPEAMGMAGAALTATQGEKGASLLLDYASVQLFVERARQADLSFRLSSRNGPAVADVCRRLDGIPLAIELAAARVRSLSPGEINARLNNRFALLTTRTRAALPRQQTLRALIDWSYSLLESAEKRLLARLSVFAGGWTLEVAEAVCSGDGIEAGEVLEWLTGLSDKSLVVSEARDDGTRYRLLETIRDYAAEKLGEWGEAEKSEIRRRHRDWFLARIQAATGDDVSLEAPWTATLDAEYDNLRAALEWCLRLDNGNEEAEVGLRLARGLALYWERHCYYTEGRMWLERVLARFGEEIMSLSRARVLQSAAALAYFQMDLPAAKPLARAALALSERLGDTFRMAKGHMLLGNIALSCAEVDEAQAQFERALVAYERMGERSLVANVLNSLGQIAVACGDLGRARALFEEMLVIACEIEDKEHEAEALFQLAWLSLHHNDTERARVQVSEVLTLVRVWASRPSRLHPDACLLLCLAAFWEDRIAEAWDHILVGLKAAREWENRATSLWLLELGSMVLPLLGRAEPATTMLAATRALRSTLGVPGCGVPGHFQATYDEHISGRPLKAILGEAAFAAAWTEGQVMSWEQAIDYALATADALLPPTTAV